MARKKRKSVVARPSERKSKMSKDEVVNIVSGSAKNSELKPGVIYTHIYEREANDMKRLRKWHASIVTHRESVMSGKKGESHTDKSKKKDVPKIFGFKKSKDGVVPIIKKK